MHQHPTWHRIAYMVKTALLCLGLAFLSPLQASDAQAPTYTVGVVPQFDPVSIHNFWTPFLHALSEQVDARFKIKHYVSIPRFEEDVLAGGPDFAFMNPYHAVMARNAQGYIPLLRDDSKALQGILVCRKDGPIKSLEDLNGSELFFPAPNAFGASLYMRALLAGQHGISFSSRYVLSHGNVYRNVILGRADAGGGVLRTLNQEPPEIRDQLRILYTTPGVAPHPFSAHPRVPARLRQQIIDAVMAMAENPATQPLLKPVQLKLPVSTDYARDYAPLEQLKLDGYFVKAD